MSGEDKDSTNMKELRRRNPSGWLEMTDGQGLPFVVDALLDAPPGREFNKTELGDRAGYSRETVRNYIGKLVDLGVVEEIPDTSPKRYRLNEDGRVTQEIFDLNSAVNAVRSGQDKNIDRTQPEIDLEHFRKQPGWQRIKHLQNEVGNQESDEVQQGR